jgi:hypothetical protein
VGDGSSNLPASPAALCVCRVTAPTPDAVPWCGACHYFADFAAALSPTLDSPAADSAGAVPEFLLSGAPSAQGAHNPTGGRHGKAGAPAIGPGRPGPSALVIECKVGGLTVDRKHVYLANTHQPPAARGRGLTAAHAPAPDGAGAMGVYGATMQPNVLSRLFSSRKVWVALSALILSVSAAFGVPEEKVAPVVTSISVLAAAVIGGIAYEDGKEKSVQPMLRAVGYSTCPDGTSGTVGGEAPGRDQGSAPSDGPRPAEGTAGTGALPPAGAAPLSSATIPLMLASLLLAGAASGCHLSAAPSYVDADRATYDVVAPDHRRYVEADPTLDDAQKARRGRLLDSWRQRIDAASK